MCLLFSGIIIHHYYLSELSLPPPLPDKLTLSAPPINKQHCDPIHEQNQWRKWEKLGENTTNMNIFNPTKIQFLKSVKYQKIGLF